jgi:hypothetical protein
MRTYVLLINSVFLFASCNKNSSGRLDMPIETIQNRNDSVCTIKHSNYFKKDVLSFQSKDNRNVCIYNSDSLTNIDSMNYLVLDVYQNNPYSLSFFFFVFKKQGQSEVTVQQGGEKNIAGKETPWIVLKIGIMPGLHTQVIFPLSYLDNQNIFLKRFPRQMKGVIFGHRMDKQEISKITIGYYPYEEPDYTSSIEINSVYFSKDVPAPLPNVEKPIVDEFGQWSVRDWPGKIHSESELKKSFSEIDKQASSATYPENWSKYGGTKDKKFNATGFFHTHHDGKRWWLVDPEGYAFLSVGVDCIRDNTSCPIDNDKDLFSWLPDSNDAVYKHAFTKSKRGIAGVDFFRTNMIRVYGKDWHSKWEEITSGMLKLWSVNTIANWSDIAMARKADIPYVYNMAGFPTTTVKLFRDFPDVFSQEYRDAAVKYAQQLDSLKDDPYLIGYFLSNEPNWAFGSFNLALEMFAVNTPSATKNELAGWLKNKYGNDLKKFNESWNMKLNSFGDISSQVIKDISTISQTAQDDLYEFTKVMVREYVKVACSEVKKIDKNHLNLGLRYAWISSDLCYEAGTDFDVFSINSYANPAPDAAMIKEITKRSGKPVIIGEFHFGAVDRGLPATGIQGAENQSARGDAYRYYVEQTVALPEIIGVHYFQWLDQPVTGRFDGEDYNIGFLDICSRPYDKLVKAAKETHERMYKVADGKEKPFDKVIKKVPQIYY